LALHLSRTPALVIFVILRLGSGRLRQRLSDRKAAIGAAWVPGRTVSASVCGPIAMTR
jgi:hypothetical protein